MYLTHDKKRKLIKGDKYWHNLGIKHTNYLYVGTKMFA